MTRRCVPRLTLVLGGARSGKSRFAERLAAESGHPVLYVATAAAQDEEMRRRVEAHRRRRPRGWRTLEAEQQVAQAVVATRRPGELVLVEDLALLTSNYLLAAEASPPSSEFTEALSPEALARAEAALARDLEALCALDGPLVVVSNEVGMGVVPAYPLGRHFRDLLGQANQFVAERAEHVYLLVAGIPLRVKGD